MHIPKQLSDRQWDLYCVGNGRMAAYWNRGEMEGLFGPSYSAPDMLTLRHADAVPRRRRRSAGHSLQCGTLRWSSRVSRPAA